ncbi:Negative regulator of mitotic exit [Balamuthia mandrillaris]
MKGSLWLVALFCGLAFLLPQSGALKAGEWRQLSTQMVYSDEDLANDGTQPYLHYGLTLNTVGDYVYLLGRPVTEWKNYAWRIALSNLSDDSITPTWEKILDNDDPQRNWDPIWFQMSTVDEETIWYYGGTSFCGSCWRSYSIAYNTETNDWDFYDEDDAPDGRESAPVTMISDNEMLLFGGCGGTPYPHYPNMNDMHIFNTDTQTWTEIDIMDRLKNADGVVGNSNTTGVTFDGRCGHTAAYLNVSLTSEFYNETLNETQTVIDGYKEVVLYYGGHANGGFLDELWEYDIADQTLQQLFPIGARPEARCYHGMVVVNNIMFIFGGDGIGRDHLNDLWAYIYEYNKWVVVGGVGSDVVPLPRAHMATTYVPSSQALVVFGGLAHEPNGNNKYMEDFWAYGLGCPNGCSGNGDCLSLTVCDCYVCWAGSDCSVRVNNDESCITRVEAEEEYASGETSSDTLIYALVGSIVGGVVLLLLIAGLFSWGSVMLFKRWKAQQAAGAAA